MIPQPPAARSAEVVAAAASARQIFPAPDSEAEAEAEAEVEEGRVCCEAKSSAMRIGAALSWLMSVGEAKMLPIRPPPFSNSGASVRAILAAVSGR